MIKYFLAPVLILSLIGNIIFSLVIVSRRSVLFAGNTAAKNENLAKITTASPVKSKDDLFEEINPVAGVDLNVSLGSLGPKMIASGVIDLAKFKAAYKASGQEFGESEETTLTQGTAGKLKINGDNSYFLLNFFWAVGLSNKTKILTGGEMMRFGGKKEIGNFASTGGWTLGKDLGTKYYGQGNLITLTPQQEALVTDVASNIYRPCCNNSTAFPDCNHGMALLGLLELMVSQGASKDQMYAAAKYVNAYWFPGIYYDLARYFKIKENKRFRDVDAQIVLSKEYSSAQGAQSVKKWLIDKGIIDEPSPKGGGCGV